jgi:hypothetical protein
MSNRTPTTMVMNEADQVFFVRYMPSGTRYYAPYVSTIPDGMDAVGIYDASRAGDAGNADDRRAGGYGPLGELVGAWSVQVFLGAGPYGGLWEQTANGGLPLAGSQGEMNLGADTLADLRAWVRGVREAMRELEQAEREQEQARSTTMPDAVIRNRPW